MRAPLSATRSRSRSSARSPIRRRLLLLRTPGTHPARTPAASPALRAAMSSILRTTRTPRSFSNSPAAYSTPSKCCSILRRRTVRVRASNSSYQLEYFLNILYVYEYTVLYRSLLFQLLPSLYLPKIKLFSLTCSPAYSITVNLFPQHRDLILKSLYAQHSTVLLYIRVSLQYVYFIIFIVNV